MYALGVDLGTTFTGVATWRDGRAEVVSLGSRSAVVPSVVLVREDGTVLTGEAANRRALTEPHRVAREFKRRFGDPTPILLGGSPYTADDLMAKLLRAVVDDAAQREGGPPARICLTHPANWGTYKQELLEQAVRLAGLDQPVTYATEPHAAAGFYAHQERIGPGSVVAVYDLGGGTFDAAVLRQAADGFALLGQPEGIERLGGIDIDAAVFEHVRRTLGSTLDELDEDDPTVVAAVARLREECTAAKEALSSDTDVTIPVLLPSGSSEVRLTRAELEAMVRPSLHSTVAALRRAVQSADLDPEQLHSVLLVGGASRMPLVAQLVGADLGRPVTVDAHPKHAVALGAAWLAAGPPEPGSPPGRAAGRAAVPAAAPPPVAPRSPAPAGSPAAAIPPTGAVPPTAAGSPTTPISPAPAGSPTAAIPATPAGSPTIAGRAAVPGPPRAALPPAPVPDQDRRRRWPLLAATAAVLAVLGAGAYALAAAGGQDPTTPTGGGRTTAAPTATVPAAQTGEPESPPESPPDQATPPGPASPSVHTSPATEETAEPPATVTIDVWFLRDGTLVATSRTRPFTLATSQLALDELAAGPSAAEAGEGLISAVPGDLTFNVSISDGVAIVDFPGSFFADGGIARMRSAQVVYTLTQFPTVSAVGFQADGEALGAPVTRADYADLLP